MKYILFYLMTFLFSFLHELTHAGAAKLFGCGFSIGTAGIFGNVVYVRSEGSTVFIKTSPALLSGLFTGGFFRKAI